MRRRILALPLLLLLVPAGIPSPAATPSAAAQPAPPVFRDCRLEHPQGARSVAAQCTEITVPEDRQRPEGRQLRLFVARIPALARDAAADPLVVLSGGPGLATSQFYVSVEAAFERVLRKRDILLVDQRGTGRSAPLACPFDEQRMWVADTAETVRVMAECRDRLGRDHDLAQYTTSVAVQDLDAVRSALGIGRLNLYGNSYGTRVAQHYARRHPQHTRAVLLDGVVPPARILGPTTPLDAQAALDRLFARCRDDAGCAAAFGDPRGDYEALRDRLRAAPVALDVAHPRTGRRLQLEFSLPVLAGTLRLAAYSADQATLLPLALQLANRDGNYGPLVTQFLMTAGTLGDLLAYGMHNSVVCSEDVPFFESAGIDRGRLEGTFIGTAQLDSLVALCAGWPRGPRDPDLHAPLASRAPALLLSGSADPVTPAAWGAEAARGFTHALHVVLQDQGHGQLLAPCVDRLMADFLDAADDPARATALDAGCARRLQPPPFFLGPGGPGP